MKKSSPTKSVRRRFHLEASTSRLALGLMGLLALVTTCFFLARAANPPSAVIGPDTAPVSFVGSAVGGTAATEAACVDGVNCDTL